ncbi:hypothetical protein CFP56_038069 [Quercus suber]
MEPSHQL